MDVKKSISSVTKRGTNSKESDAEAHKVSPDNTKTDEEAAEPIYAVITPKSKRCPDKSTVVKGEKCLT